MNKESLTNERLKNGKSVSMGWGDEKDPGKPGRGAATLGRMQRTNKGGQFYKMGEGAIVGVGPWLRHSVELLLALRPTHDSVSSLQVQSLHTLMVVVAFCTGCFFPRYVLYWDFGTEKWSQRKRTIRDIISDDLGC